MLSFEAMERREVLSTISVLNPSVHVLAKGRSTVFNGSGRASLNGTALNPDGTISATGSINGRATQIGTFTGSIQSTTSANLAHSSAAAILTASNGDQVDLSITGTYKLGKRTIQPGSFRFTVTGGTGHFLGATGSGRLSGNLNLKTEVLSFTFSGRLVP
jgi:hypothetical protein